MKLPAILFLTLCPLFCLFSEVPLEIDAECVNYDGKLISLEGRAVVDHDLGIVEAQKVLIIPEKEGKKMRFSHLKMEKGVQITLKEGGQLNCELAELDYHGLTGTFLGNDSQPYAIYKENFQGKNEQTLISLEVKSPELDVYLHREPIALHRMTTGHPVFVHYNNDISAQAEAGSYERKNEQQDVFSLKGNVEITYEGVGKLKTPQEILVHRQLKQVHLMECLGESLLDYHDDNRKESHQLITHHKLTLDRQQNLAHLESPLDENKRVIDGLQVHLTGSMGDIYADEAFIHYQEDHQRLKPIKLLLKGNIRLTKLDTEKIVHLALADRVEYEVATQEILCLSDYGKRVLFLDKANNLQVSAPAVKVRRDLKTRKETIQGIGDVRFSFIEKERELLQKHFQEYER